MFRWMKIKKQMGPLGEPPTSYSPMGRVRSSRASHQRAACFLQFQCLRLLRGHVFQFYAQVNLGAIMQQRIRLPHYLHNVAHLRANRTRSHHQGQRPGNDRSPNPE